MVMERGESSNAPHMRMAAAAPVGAQKRTVKEMERSTGVKHMQATGPATVLAIGTATPPTAFEQATYPDFYFRITNCEDKTALKSKFRRICE